MNPSYVRNGVALAILLSVGFMALSWSYHEPSVYQHRSAVGDYPTAYNSLFTGSGSCIQCHGHDTAMIASVDVQGNDVNVVDAWSSTMMANSAKDPFWIAKVSHEVLANPGLQTEI
ncbi:MAG: mono/diheme cytochrome c family protein, partial [Flavobacteriales bacterium]